MDWGGEGKSRKGKSGLGWGKMDRGGRRGGSRLGKVDQHGKGAGVQGKGRVREAKSGIERNTGGGWRIRWWRKRRVTNMGMMV